MKKGISIWSFANPNLKDAFKLAKEAGFEGVEVAMDEDGQINLNSTYGDMQEIKKLAEDAGIELYSLACGLYWQYSMTDSDPRVRQKSIDIAKKQLEIASWLGCQSILMIPGHVSVCFQPDLEVVPYKKAYEMAFDAVKSLAPIAEQFKVQLCVENVWNQLLLSPLEMKQFIDDIDSPYVGAYFDVGNVVVNGYPEHWIEILAEKIYKVHFKDYRKSAYGLGGFVDLLAGDVNYPAVMEEFKKTGYDGWVTAEMLPPYTHYPEVTVYNASKAMDAILSNK